jgi:hypothetical protein
MHTVAVFLHAFLRGLSAKFLVRRQCIVGTSFATDKAAISNLQAQHSKKEIIG